MEKKGIAITLTPEKSEEFFHNALCNGLSYFSGYGIEINYRETEYKAARAALHKKNQSVCYEDVLMKILRDGGSLEFTDVENGGDMTRLITLADVHEKVQHTPFRFLSEMIEERDDAETADVIIQTVLYDEIVFG